METASSKGAYAAESDRVPGRVRLACVATGLVALLVLLGWLLGIEALKRIHPAWIAMNPLTAVLFLACATALWRRRLPGRRPAASWLAGGVCGLGFVLAIDQLAAWPGGPDQWLFHDALAGNTMALGTAVSFAMAGLSLLLLDHGTRPGRRPSEWLAAAIALNALWVMLGYAYGVREVVEAGTRIPMAAHTALLFMLLAGGLLASRRTVGVAGLFSGSQVESIAARRFLAGSVVIVAGIGWLRLAGERAGLYGTEVGVALFTTLVIALLAALVASSAWALHRAEVERRHAESDRRRLFAVTPDLLCVAGFDGYFRDVNPAWTALLGWSREELLSRPFLEFVHPHDIAPSQATLSRLGEGVPAIAFENRFLAKDGGTRCISWNAMPVPEEGVIYCSGRDVTEARDARESIRRLNGDLVAKAAELQQSNRELEAFSYTISHDLRAPLRHVDGYARMLAEDAGDGLDAECRRYVEEIGGAARRMGALIDDLLAFSRLGRKPVEKVPLDMAALVARVVEETGGAGRVHVGALPDAPADPVLLRQVWVNLVSNALKYGAPRGDALRVEIDGERIDGGVRYRVRDNGVGFDMRFADKLFGVFQRLHSADDFEGTGVGLAIVQQIVVRHGGTVGAESSPGQGATFRFDLPAAGHGTRDTEDEAMTEATG
ncbi:sensor histidine kinase [Luteimonas pelagia]